MHRPSPNHVADILHKIWVSGEGGASDCLPLVGRPARRSRREARRVRAGGGTLGGACTPTRSTSRYALRFAGLPTRGRQTSDGRFSIEVGNRGLVAGDGAVDFVV